MFALVVLTGRLTDAPSIRRRKNGKNIALLSVNVLSRTTPVAHPVKHRILVQDPEIIERLLEASYVAGALLQISGELDYHVYTSDNKTRHHRMARIIVAPPIGALQLIPQDPPQIPPVTNHEQQP